MNIQFNMNENVEVTLTKFGAKVINDDRAEIRKLVPEYAPKAYSEGDVLKDQLWSVMQTFGPHIHMGMVEVPFKDNIITILEK